MADSSNGRPSFWTQADALLRKNFTFQKRNMKENIRLIIFPFLICVFLVLLQKVINSELEKPKNTCGCVRADLNGDGRYEKLCGIEYSTVTQATSCAVPNPPEWPPLLQVPSPMHRAVQPGESDFDRCRESWSCPATFLLTGNNQSLGSSLSLNMLSLPSPVDFSDILYSLANNVLGSDTKPSFTYYLEPAFTLHHPIYRLQSLCFDYSEIFVSIRIGSVQVPQEARCVDGQMLWLSSSSEINRELYRGFWKGNSKRDINEFVAAYDFLNSNLNNFNLSVWYNSTYKRDSGNTPIAVTRVPRSVNLATNAYLQTLLGPGTKILFEFVKEMPKPETQLRLDLASLLGPLFFTWVILQLFPVILTSLVYEKQQKLRIMMKMHGLGDGPYWLISYAYFLVLSLAYMLCFVIFGSLIGLKFFTLNSYVIQFLFYFVYINLQISLAFLVASVFSNVKTAAVIGYIMVFGTGLLGGFLFQFFIQDPTFPRVGIIAMEIYPGFSLYRGLYEFAQYAFAGNYVGGAGMLWSDLSDSNNGMEDVLVIMSVEWVVILFIAYCVDRVTLFKCGVRKSPLFCLQNLQKKSLSPVPFANPSIEGQRSQAIVQMEKPDVAMEVEKVKQLLLEPTMSRAIICHDLKKVYPGRDGNPEKFAVRGLSLSVSQGECFGMLGPNGAGKTSFINMMIGLMKPSSGAAYVQGLNIETRMDEIYTSMGVCPQHDLLWGTLTGREHLLFYGRLKNLKGQVLSKAVEESLRRVNLLHGGVADQRAGKYSGGMKRRLSVAISLIGDPKVVYMDEPSTGLDPASRNNLWNVIKQAKQKRAIILTTHSMEEADHLCDRLGIFVDGNLQCIGNPKELKARYGGSYVFTMTTSSNHESEVEKLVENLSKNAHKIYHLSGTQKFELPKDEVRIAEVFRAVSNAKSRFPVYAWGVADTTLEDVFIKVARGAQAFDVLS